MEEKIETIQYRGHSIDIYQDTEFDSDILQEDDFLFLVNYHRDFEVRKDEIITKENVANWYRGEKIEQEKDYYIFELSCLVHGMVALSLGGGGFVGDSAGWDTSHVGAVLVSRKEAEPYQEAKEMAFSLVGRWNELLSGRVFGYLIDDEKGGCWGLLGDYRKSGLIEEAKTEIDSIVEENKKKNNKRVKAYIRNGVPLEKREKGNI